MHQQQMELHQAQMQYASYGVMPVGCLLSIRAVNCPFLTYLLLFKGYAPPPPSAAPPPPPPGEQPPPPPGDGAAGAGTAAAAPAPTDLDAYTAYWYAALFNRERRPLMCRTGLLMATTLTRPSSKSGKQAKWHNTTNTTLPRGTQLLAPIPLPRGRRLLRLPVRRHHHRLLREPLRLIHAHICRPNLYICFCHCGRFQYIMDLVPVARRT